nr:response regulator [Desulfobulbaceae bacterium]
MSLAISIKKFLGRYYLISLLISWTVLIITSVTWNLSQNYSDTIAKARIEARTIFQHNIAYRKWSTMHGGIYTKISNINKGTPHFMFNIGNQGEPGFAMVDPFQMTKQAYEVLHKQAPTLAAISHTVSLDHEKTYDPYDEPDEWERTNLMALKEGEMDEASTIETINDAPYLRLLKPYVIDQGCLKCHSNQDDYTLGSIRGGMSVSVPLEPYFETEVSTRRTVFLTHLLLWILGSIAILKFSAAFKKYRETITENEEKFRIVSEFAYNFEYWIKENNELAFISPSCERLTGYSREEFMTNPKLLLDIIHQDDIEGYRNHLTNISAPEHDGTDFRIIRRDGEIRWFTHTCSPIYIKGEFLGRRGSSIDVTEHKNLEEQLMQAKQLEYLGQFAGGIAHDFNNVLGSIKTFTHLLHEEIKDTNKAAADYIKYISIASKLGKNLTSNLLSFGKRQIVNPQRTTLKAIISNISDILKTLVDDEIQYCFNFSAEDVEISADPHQLEQILINLCTNARDAMENGGKITISTNAIQLKATKQGTLEDIPPGSYLTLALADTGKGIPEEHLNKICQPFFTTKSSSKGTGLGLSIIHTIVKQHNAFLDVESVKDAGTTFTIYIPALSPIEFTAENNPIDPEVPEVPEVKLEQIENATDAQVAYQLSDIPSVASQGKTILLADDEDLIRKSLSIPLEKTGYKVLLASDGKKAISLFLDKKEEIDLVILDVILPYRNGREVYEIIRKNDQSINIIFISGYTDDIISAEMIEKENLNFLSKPIDIQLFMATVEKLITKNEIA